MLNGTIITVGKLKETYWKSACAEYVKRLRPYAKIDIIELPEEPFFSKNERAQIIGKEALRIEKILSNLSGELIVLDERGTEYSSKEFAEFLKQNSQRGEKLIFVIGGPLGLDDSILKKAHHRIALSRLTFTHQMARVILLEQLYRSVTIINKKQYHY